MDKISKLTMLLLILLTVCSVSQRLHAETSIYVFDPNQSTVIQASGFAVVLETYVIEGKFQLTVDFDAGIASFDMVDANLTEPTGFLYTRSLGVLFNMTGLAGIVVDDTTIQFEGKTTDGTESNVRLKLSFSDDSAHLIGQTIQPPDSAYMSLYDIDAVATKKYAGGTGEPNDPYLIYTAEQMNAIGAEPNDWDKHFKLMADIDLAGYIGTDFNIIGYWVDWNSPDNNPFAGVFDGNGRTISNFTSKGTNHIGLFGYVDGKNAHIKDLGIIDPNIDAQRDVGSLVGHMRTGAITGCYVEGGSVGGSSNVGGLVGFQDYGTITNCYTTVSVSGDTSAGGLVGINNWWCRISNCYSAASVSGKEYVGGLVGLNRGTIANCYVQGGSVLGSNIVGGFVGSNGWPQLPMARSYPPGEITNCYSTASVSGSNHVGGLVGRQGYGRLTASFWDIQTCGQTISDGGTGKTTAEMQMAVTFLDAGWDFVEETDNGTEDIWKITEGLSYPRLSWQKYSGGSGEPNDPYQIATAEDLITLGDSPEDYGKHFILTADIDLDPNLPGRKVFDRAVIKLFSGCFDGQDYVISNLHIQGNSYLGLFGQLNSGAKISNLGLEAVDVNGSSNVSGLAGVNSGNISSSYSTGMVTGNENIGGLVGSNVGNITMCYSSGVVTGNWLVGGLVGVNWRDIITESITITASHSTVMVSGDIYVGGLVGGNGGNYGANITTCYSTGAVSGDRYVGGLVGINSYGADGGAITNCYSTGMVTGNEDVGGLVGVNASLGNITSGLWDVETSGQTTSDGGIDKTTSEMQDPNTFIAVGWDFISQPDGPHDIWIEPEGGGYPMLWWQSPSGYVLPVFAGGKGEPNDPYMISTVEQLNAIGHNPKLMESHFKLIDNLDVTDLHFYSIGSLDYPYRGVFEGNGHTISHLRIEGVSYLGLFSVIGDGAEVKNLGLVDVNITGLDGSVGGLVGLNLGSIVTNCFSTGMVTGGDWYVGGLVGYNDNGKITGSYSAGSITGDSDVGGLVGYNNNGSIIGSYSTATVTGGDWHIGGLVGINNGIINASYSTGTVTGTLYHVGGLAGKNTDLTSGAITNCYSTSTVSGVQDVGGLVGRNAYSWEDGTIANCYSTGMVAGNTDVGGLVGSSDGNITNCSSIGVVTGDSRVGGLVGDNSSRITACYSTGVVSGRGDIGGLVGKNWSNIATSYSTSIVSGNENVGGLVGYSSWGRIVMSYGAGTVKGNINVGGLVGQDRGEVVVTACFWDIETCGQTYSAGGTGKKTSEMQTAITFLEAGWDFVDETANGTEDIWWILEGQDYPRLWWELSD